MQALGENVLRLSQTKINFLEKYQDSSSMVLLAPNLLVLSLPFRIKESCPLMTCALRLAAGRPGLVLDVGANGAVAANRISPSWLVVRT